MTYNDDIFTHADAARERLMFALENEYLPGGEMTMEEAIHEATLEHGPDAADGVRQLAADHPGAFRKPQEKEQP